MTRPDRPHVDVLAYGTLRQRPDGYSTCTAMCPSAELIGEPGEWIVPRFALWGYSNGIPATNWTGDAVDRVVGDIWRVDLHDFARLLEYESYPTLYQYEEVNALSMRRMIDPLPVVMFTTSDAWHFGPKAVDGDWMNSPRETDRDRHLVSVKEKR